jgi:hypothetical protein
MAHKRYRTNYYFRYLLGAGFLLFFGLSLVVLAILLPFIRSFSLRDWIMDVSLALVGFICLVMAILGPYGESRTCLITSPEGIEYQGFGFHVYTSWDNVDRVEIIPRSQYALEPDKAEIAAYIRNRTKAIGRIEAFFPEAYMECLVLRHPLFYEKKEWAKKMIRNQTGYIPLLEFPWWRNSELAQDIRQFAPHVGVG